MHNDDEKREKSVERVKERRRKGKDRKRLL
jgi:hypothetical protein